MDKKQKKKVVLTYILAIVVMVVLFFGIPLTAAIAGIFPEELQLDIDANILINFAMAAVSLGALFVYWLIFRRRKFKGVFSFKKCGKEVYIGLLIVMVLDVILLIMAGFFMEGGIKALVPPTVMTFSISIAAGVFEETVFRAFPVSILMKNQPSTRRIYLAVLITAFGFAIAHAANVNSGASVQMTILQVCSCLITGIFLAAIYLRTGSMLFPMFFHFFHDIINLMDPMQSTGVLVQQTITVSNIVVEVILGSSELLVAIYLLRKVNHEDIKKRWAEIWSE